MQQVLAARNLLFDCIDMEMRLAEIIKKNSDVFSGLLGYGESGGLSREAERQMMERLSAIEMLNVLAEFAAEEELATAAASQAPNP